MAPDGEAGTRGTKLNVLTTMMGRYREGAMEMLQRDPKVREAFMRRELRVRDAYREAIAAKAEGRPVASGRPGLKEAFGVDLGNLFGGGAETQ